LAIALELPGQIDNPTNEKVRDTITDMGYNLNPMKGVRGTYYTKNRYKDLTDLAKELLV